MSDTEKAWMSPEERVSRMLPRSCGEGTNRCSLCCKLLPVENLHPANHWCGHAIKGKGCAIYADRPGACKAWACLWVSVEESEYPDLRRPDKTHYVIDEAADIVTIGDQQLSAMQVWVDPGYPTAWRQDPALRRMILQYAEAGLVTMIRNGDGPALVILAPPFAPEWEELRSNVWRPHPTTDEEKIKLWGKPSP